MADVNQPSSPFPTWGGASTFQVHLPWGSVVVAVALAFQLLGMPAGRKDQASKQGDPEPGPTPPEQEEPIDISGNERLAWDYELRSPEQLDGLRFLAYIDNTPTLLSDAACEPVTSELLTTCVSRLPVMDPGVHVIEVAAYVGDESAVGFRSTPIRVRVSSTQISPDLPRDRWPTATPQNVQLQVNLLATNLVDATDLGILADGRVLIAERAGRIRLFKDGRLADAPAATLDDISTGEGRGLLALAIDADFDRTRAVYAVYTSDSGARLVRFNAAGDMLGSRSILLDGLPLAPSHPAASLRMGPDHRLYLALDDGGRPTLVGDLGSFNGKVLRLNRDGTTPSDQAALSPVFAPGMRRPAGLAWHSEDDTFWVANREANQVDAIMAFAAESPLRRGTLLSRQLLHDGGTTAGVVIYESTAIPALTGTLLVASNSPSGSRILAANPRRMEESASLPLQGVTDVRGLGLAGDGAIVVLTSSTLLRITAGSK